MGLACWPRRRAIAFTDNGAPRTTKRFRHTLLAIFSARSEKQRLADLRPPPAPGTYMSSGSSRYSWQMKSRCASSCGVTAAIIRGSVHV